MISPKRYAVFHGEKYYPTGGWKDKHKLFDTLDEATAFCIRLEMQEDDWYQIVDIFKDEILAAEMKG